MPSARRERRYHPGTPIILRRQTGESSAPLLDNENDEDEDDSADEQPEEAVKPTMKFFDNVTKWDRTKVYRYSILLALSLRYSLFVGLIYSYDARLTRYAVVEMAGASHTRANA